MTWGSAGNERTHLMASHLLVMLVFAALVSLVFAVLLKDEPVEQVRLGGLLFGAFVGTGVVLGWILFPFPL
jgi:hypothetical protein